MSDTNVTDQGGAGGLASFLNQPSLDAPAGPAKPVVQESAGTSTDMGVYTKSSIQESQQEGAPTTSSGNVDPNNPTPVAPDPLLADLTPDEANKAKVNAFLGGIYAVALEELMALQVKVDSYTEKVMSENYVMTKEQEEELAELKAELQEKAGKIEMYKEFAQAVGCGVSAGVGIAQAGGAYKFGGVTTKNGAIHAGVCQSMDALGGQNSVFSHIASGIGSMEKSQVEAQITLLEFAQKFAQETADSLVQSRRETADAKKELLQAYNNFMNALFAFTKG